MSLTPSIKFPLCMMSPSVLNISVNITNNFFMSSNFAKIKSTTSYESYIIDIKLYKIICTTKAFHCYFIDGNRSLFYKYIFTNKKEQRACTRGKFIIFDALNEAFYKMNDPDVGAKKSNARRP